jgi:hypothetical protein
LSAPEAKFKINVKEGSVELEGNEQFVDKHLEKFEEIFKFAIQEAVKYKFENTVAQIENGPSISLPSETVTHSSDTSKRIARVHKHPAKSSIIIPPTPVDLKANENKIGLREFVIEKRPANHYEKVAVFVYYLTKFNHKEEAKFGEILSCYEEVGEKKPSIIDIVKNSIRYKGWLEVGQERFSTRITISGENFVKFDLPQTSS